MGYILYNRLSQFDFGWDLGGNAPAVIIGNRLQNITTISNNVPVASWLQNNCSIGGQGFEALAANSATPSVGNFYAPTYRTQNTAPTTITSFTQGYYGQQFILNVNDTNTTLQHNAGLILRGFVNVTPPAGGTLTFVYDSLGSWRETARSF
jgi:hypothetical protein